MRVVIVGLLAWFGATVLATLAAAQETDASVSKLDDIVVVARRSGAPVWQVRNGDAAVTVVGTLSDVPADTPWRPDALESAVLQADHIVISQSATMSLGDFLRMRRVRARLPEGTTTQDYLPPQWQARLEARGRAYRVDYSRRGLTWIAADLTRDRLRYPAGMGSSPDAVVRATARRARSRLFEVGSMDARHISETVALPDAAQVACLTASIQANEDGAEGVRARALAWTRQDVPAVLLNPVTVAEDRCGWFADEALITEGRRQWSKAVSEALARSGTTMIVAPISIVAEPGGLLDQIEAGGLDVVGPAWSTGTSAEGAVQ